VPSEPLGHRLGVDDYAHVDQLAKLVTLPPGETNEPGPPQLRAPRLSPSAAGFAHAVLDDFVKGFALSPTTAHNDVPVSRWQSR